MVFAQDPVNKHSCRAAVADRTDRLQQRATADSLEAMCVRAGGIARQFVPQLPTTTTPSMHHAGQHADY